MKKILVLILAFALIFGMIGCGGGEVYRKQRFGGEWTEELCENDQL